MKDVFLERFCYSDIMGTFGKLKVDDFECLTVERPWLNNKVGESCIPEGAYELKLGFYNRGGYPCYEIDPVPDRTLIKIHIANTIDDVIGCVGLGMGLGYIENKWAVTSSERALNDVLAASDGEEL